MNDLSAIRSFAKRLKHETRRDWPAYWLAYLSRPRLTEYQRNHAHRALAALGHPQRTPGEDDDD